MPTTDTDPPNTMQLLLQAVSAVEPDRFPQAQYIFQLRQDHGDADDLSPRIFRICGNDIWKFKNYLICFHSEGKAYVDQKYKSQALARQNVLVLYDSLRTSHLSIGKWVNLLSPTFMIGRPSWKIRHVIKQEEKARVIFPSGPV